MGWYIYIFSKKKNVSMIEIHNNDSLSGTFFFFVSNSRKLQVKPISQGPHLVQHRHFNSMFSIFYIHRVQFPISNSALISCYKSITFEKERELLTFSLAVLFA
jgi:hypothetical protein